MLNVQKEQSKVDLGKRNGIEDKRVSVCVPCRRGIYKFQEYTWTNEGYVHTGCLNEEFNEIKSTA